MRNENDKKIAKYKVILIGTIVVAVLSVVAAVFTFFREDAWPVILEVTAESPEGDSIEDNTASVKSTEKSTEISKNSPRAASSELEKTEISKNQTSSACNHNWTPVTHEEVTYKKVHHDRVTHEEDIYEDVPFYYYEIWCECPECDYWILEARWDVSGTMKLIYSNDNATTEVRNHIIEVHGLEKWPVSVVHPQVLYGYEKQYVETVTVVDREAWDEQVIDQAKTITDKYICTKCGEEKNP